MQIHNFKVGLIVAVLSCSFMTTAAADTAFGVVGDVPYGKKALARFPELVSSIEASSIEFVDILEEPGK